MQRILHHDIKIITSLVKYILSMDTFSLLFGGLRKAIHTLIIFLYTEARTKLLTLKQTNVSNPQIFPIDSMYTYYSKQNIKHISKHSQVLTDS